MIPELVTLLESLIGKPIPSQSITTTVVENGITTVSTVANGYDLQYAFMAALVILFFIGFFIILHNFQKSFGGIKK